MEKCGNLYEEIIQSTIIQLYCNAGGKTEGNVCKRQNRDAPKMRQL